jgi:polyisoprenoid-binding protein YceI
MNLLLALVLAGCAEDVSAGKTEAVVTHRRPPRPRRAPAEATAPAMTSQVLPIDVAQSDIHALGAKVTGTETVRFSKWSGVAQIVDGKVQGVHVDVDVTSLDTGKAKLNGHLNSGTSSTPRSTRRRRSNRRTSRKAPPRPV